MGSARLSRVMLWVVLLGLPLSAWARPAMRVVSQEEGDATISLSLESQYIEDDSVIPCEVNVVVLGENRPFTLGDTISIEVKEDDGIIGDDSIWAVEVVVDDAIADVQQFSMTYDCSFPSIGDQIGSIEVYAKVDVDKDDCGRLCELSFGEDTPSTANIYMQRVNDDDAEDDDTRQDAVEDPMRLTSDRVCRDADWFRVSYDYPVELLARLESHLVGGDLELKLYDQNLTLVATANEEMSGVSKSLRPSRALQAGQYWLEVTPSDSSNFNFYDLYVVESEVMTDCVSGSIETRPCGDCGREERSCNDGGEWGQWSMCVGTGVCAPGAEETQGCTDGGSRVRLCNAACEWGEYSSCVECEDGSVESCYTGPAENAGVGACLEGSRTCSRGQWSSCQGDILPRDEICSDAVDNDCNGFTDANDPVCAAQVGDACGPGDCGGEYECLMGPFEGGYCGGSSCASCTSDSVCGEVAGQEYCLKPCSGSSECRGGYQCAPAGRDGARVCIPLCSGDQDCGAGQVCNISRYCEDAQVGGSLGDACLGSMCAAPLECISGIFPGGYCGLQGCQQCGVGGACGVVAGQSFCLKTCASPGDCRDGYLCAPAGFQNELVCVPPCLSNAECGAGYICTAQQYCTVEVVSPGCGAQGPCADNQICTMTGAQGELSCVVACTDDIQCGEGRICGAGGFCEMSASADVQPLPSAPAESGCQHDRAPSLWWLILIAIVISRCVRRSYAQGEER